MKLIEKIIKINSITHHSNQELVLFLIPLLKEVGLKIEVQKIVEKGETFENLIAYSHGPQLQDLLVMNTHLDTVSAGMNESWTKTRGNPFQATQVKDRIYGLGTADVKLDFLCKLIAAKNSRPWKRPFALVGTFGEERGLIGVQHLFQKKDFRPRYALVGEPSNLELIYAHKGHLIFTVSLTLDKPKGAKAVYKEFKGRSAHSSTPNLGVNAIRKSLNDAFKRGLGVTILSGGTDTNRIPDFCSMQCIPVQTKSTLKIFQLLELIDGFSADLKKRKDIRFNPSTSCVSLNLAKMNGDSLHLSFDIRLLPDVNSKTHIERINHLCKTTGFKLEFLSCDEPLKGSKNSSLMKLAEHALKSCGVKVVKKTKASSTEAAIYHQHGAEAIVFGPGLSIGNVHRPNEYNSIKQLGIATKFYTEILKTETGKGPAQ